MGSAIAERIKRRYRVLVFDKDVEKTKGLGGKGIEAADSVASLLQQSDAVILAVKPQDFDVILNEMKDIANQKLIISIAAGIKTSHIENVLGGGKIIRVMPNLPARIGMGISYLCRGQSAKTKDLIFASRLFRTLGVVFITSEETMSTVTAVSGSGPGFWCNRASLLPKDRWRQYTELEFIPSYALEVEKKGFKKREARRIAEMVGWGSLATVQRWDISPAELQRQVASKGGTTEAGLKELERGGSLGDAINAAEKRAEELSRG